MDDDESKDAGLPPQPLPLPEPIAPSLEQPLRGVPREIGVLLIVAGIGGILLPGPVGTPLLMLGGLIVYPNVFVQLEVRFKRRFPGMYRISMRQFDRFLADLDRRYPFSR